MLCSCVFMLVNTHKSSKYRQQFTQEVYCGTCFFFGVCAKSTQPFPLLVAHTTREERGAGWNRLWQHKKPQARAREERRGGRQPFRLFVHFTSCVPGALRHVYYVVCTTSCTTSCVLGALLRRVLGVDLDVVVRQVAPPRSALSVSLTHGDVNLHRAMDLARVLHV